MIQKAAGFSFVAFIFMTIPAALAPLN